MVLWPNTLIETDENPVLSIKQPSITVLLLLQKVADRLPIKFIIAVCN